MRSGGFLGTVKLRFKLSIVLAIILFATPFDVCLSKSIISNDDLILGADFSPTGKYLSISTYKNKHVYSTVFDGHSGRFLQTISGRVLWYSHHDIGLYYRDDGAIDYIKASYEDIGVKSISDSGNKRLIEEAAEAISATADLVVWREKLKLAQGGAEWRFSACPTYSSSCYTSPAFDCPRLIDGGLLPAATLADVTAFQRCADLDQIAPQVKEIFWQVGRPDLSVEAHPNYNDELIISSDEGRQELALPQADGRSLAFRDLRSEAKRIVTAEEPVDSTLWVRSGFRTSETARSIMASPGAWAILASSGQSYAVANRSGARVCVDIARESQPALRLYCSSKAPPQAISSKAAGAPWGGFLWLPTEEPKRLVVWLHGGPFIAASPMPDVEVATWLDQGFAVLSLEYLGGAAFAHAGRPGAGSRIEQIVDETIAATKQVKALYPSIGDKVIVGGQSFGGIIALAAARRSDLARRVFITSPVCDVPSQIAFLNSRPDLAALRKPYKLLLEEGAGDLRDVSCDAMIEGPERLYITFSGADPALGPQTVSAIDGALAKRSKPTIVQRSQERSHTPFDSEDFFNQIGEAKKRLLDDK